MANNEYLNDYLQFFQYFDETFDPSDQLPVKLPSYKLVKKEVVGAIFNWTNQYLGEKKCPYHLISFLSRIVIENTRKRCKKQPIQCGFNPSENAYEPLKLMHTVIEVTNEVCFSYKLSLNVQNTRQNMAVSNPLPPPEAVYNVVSVSALKNSRRKMEDRHIVVHDLNTIFTKQDATPSHYYAVFDGHDGEDAAVYSANHLHQFLAESTNFITEPEQALRDAFCRTDSMFLSKCESENIVGGTTAVCALLLPKEKTLYIAWTGDSQAVLVSQGKVKQCVRPHKPDREDERLRIEKEGGVVIHWGIWRVNGQLGVSRAIGDAQYKPYVTAVPDIVKISLRPEDDFFVLGSDGLWDHVSEVDVAKVVYDAAWSCPDKADLVSRELVQLAKCNGSSDNISVIVVFLRHPRIIAAGPRWTDIVVGMEAIDNANDPFVVQNKANGDGGLNDHDNVVDGLLLNNINDDFDVLKKKDDMPNNDLMKMLEKSNLARLTPEFDKDDNLGPETDVDNPDGGSLSPNVDAMTLKSEAINNNQQYNPFNDIEKSLELNLNLKEGTFKGMTSPEEETCPTQTNSVHNVSQLIDAGAESDSEEEEEWNYVSGQQVNKENVLPLQLSSKVAEEEEEDDTETTMSQLNPNAAEFVPISPTRAVASPIGRVLCDEVLSESPKRAPPHEVDLNVPNPVDFDNDISQKPHEIDEGISNGHDLENDDELSARGLSKNRLDEFHFGPNAAPFTPVKLLDQSEASSTRAVYGDESVMTLGTSFNDSQDDLDRADLTAKDDPMTASFHQERDDVSNPFDPNKVHMLPDDDEEEVEDDLVHECNLSNSLMNDTISDLVEHFPLGKSDKENNPPVGFLVTDLDNDDHRSSSGNRVVSPLKSDRTESPLGDSRTESPSEHDRISIPFEEERSVSPIQDNKVSSPVEHGNLSPSSLGEDDSELCHLVAKSETPVLTGEKDDCFEKDEGIILEDTLEIHSPVQHEEVSSALQEADTICLKEDNQSIAEEKEITSTLEGDKEKCNIEEKEISSPLIEERERFMLEENFEVKKEKLIVEEKEVSSPLEDEDVLSQLESRDVKSPYEESGGVSPFGEERDVVSSSLGERDVISSSLEEKDVVSALEEKTENYPAYRDVVSPIKEINLTSPEEERALTSPVEEKDPISPMKESGLTSLVEERDLTSPLEDRGLTSAVEDGGLNAPVEERGLTSPTEDLTSPVEDTGSIPQVKEEGLTSPVEESYLNSPVQEMNLTSPVENLVTTSETQNEEMGISIEQIRESFSMQKSEEEKFTLLQTEEQKSELISAEQVYECSSESNKDGVLSEESKAEMEQKSENIPVEQKSEPVEDLKLSFQVDNEFSSSLEHRNKHLDLDDCLVKGEDGECLLQVDEIGRSGLANFGEVEGERLILSPLAPLHPPIPSDSEKLVKDIEKEEVVKVEILDVLNTGSSSDNQSNVSAEQIMACIKAEADSSHDVVATKAPIDLPLSPVHSDKDDLLHSHPTPEYDQLLAQSYELSNTRSVVESSSVVETSSVIETSGLAQASSVLESSVDLESVATTEVNSFLGRSPLPEIQSPLSSNASYVIGEATGHSTADAPSLEPTKDCLSPPRTTIQEFTNLTSTPSNGRPSSLSPLASQVLLDVTAKSPSKLTPKDAEKKTTKSSKTTPSTATARKSLTAKSSLSATSKTSPSPRPAAPSKTSKPATTKTDSALASKAPPKPIAAPKTTTARVPLASRPLTKPAISNGLPKTVPKTNTVAPTKKSVEGTARSTTSAVGHKSTTTGPSKGPATSSKSSTTTGTVSSARSSTATAAPPKPRTNSTRPAVPKPGTTTKTTSAVKPNASSTTSKVPTVSKSSTTSLTNRVPISARSQPAKSAHASTEKQIKETANKLTASKNTATARTTTTTKKIEEKSSTTKTTTKRTTATDSAAAAPAYRPPIRRPTAPSDTKTTATKVGKPKQNGVAAVVTEQIIVNKTNQQQRDSVELNGLANGDSLFVKDNSPVDNKLIVESKATTETAAN